MKGLWGTKRTYTSTCSRTYC